MFKRLLKLMLGRTKDSNLDKRKLHKKLRNHYPPWYEEKTLAIYIILRYIKSYKVMGDIVECGVV